MGLSFDAPVSATTNAYEKTYSGKSRASRIPLKARTASRASASSFFDNLSNRVRNSFHRSSSSTPPNLTSIPSSPATHPSNSVPAAESLFFRLPLELREAIYGLVVAHRETIHIMMKRRPNGRSHPLVHRICQAGGDLNDCVLHDCKIFLAAEEGQGCYFGSFASVGGILYTSRDIFQEVSNLIYTQNTFEFDHPNALMQFQKTLHPSSLNSIKSISMNLQRNLLNNVPPSQMYILLRDWGDLWITISEMDGLEEIRVKLQFSGKTMFPWPEKTILAPLSKLRRPMRVFELDFRPAICLGFEQTADTPFKLLGNNI